MRIPQFLLEWDNSGLLPEGGGNVRLGFDKSSSDGKGSVWTVLDVTFDSFPLSLIPKTMSHLMTDLTDGFSQWIPVVTIELQSKWWNFSFNWDFTLVLVKFQFYRLQHVRGNILKYWEHYFKCGIDIQNKY